MSTAQNLTKVQKCDRCGKLKVAHKVVKVEEIFLCWDSAKEIANASI